MAVIAFSLGGTAYHVTKTYIGADTFTGLCAFAAFALASCLIVGIIYEKVTKKVPNASSMPSVDQPSTAPCPPHLVDASLIKECLEYAKEVAESHLPTGARVGFMKIVQEYLSGKTSGEPSKISVIHCVNLSLTGFCHFWQNLWERVKPIDKRSTAQFIKSAFPVFFRNWEADTIYAKMINRDAGREIPLIPLGKPLIRRSD